MDYEFSLQVLVLPVHVAGTLYNHYSGVGRLETKDYSKTNV